MSEKTKARLAKINVWCIEHTADFAENFMRDMKSLKALFNYLFLLLFVWVVVWLVLYHADACGNTVVVTVGGVVTAIEVVSLVMLLILTLILGNTMAMSTRERTNEYAVMRSLGFRPAHIVSLVLAEGFVVAAIGFGVGAVLAPALISGFAEWGQKQFGSFLRGVNLTPEAMLFAGTAALVGGIVATVIPAVQAGRLNIVEALRKVD